MNTVRQLWLRLLSLASRGRLEREMEEEMRFHLEMQVEQNLAAGMAAEEARYAARRHCSNTGLPASVATEVDPMIALQNELGLNMAGFTR